jgi:hypothetical protein
MTQFFTDNKGVNHDFGYKLLLPVTTASGLTCDSTGQFFQAELNRLDPTWYAPLADITHTRDMDYREDVSYENTSSSFLRTSYGSGLANAVSGRAQKIGWATNAATDSKNANVDVAHVQLDMNEWRASVTYTQRELMQSALLNRAIDVQKFNSVALQFQLALEQQAYVGNDQTNAFGLVNSLDVAPVNVGTGITSGATLFAGKTPQEILTDFSAALNLAWTRAAFAITPNKIGIPPAQWAYLTGTQLPNTQTSLLKYILENNIVAQKSAEPLEIVPMRLLTGAGLAGLDRMVVYHQGRDFVRLPKTQMMATPVHIRGVEHSVTYTAAIGEVEIIRPETMAYVDGI